ncbi:MAG: ABC transporter permease/substrate-binding protein [Candidatus Zixiibacteriota bacterium]
MTWQALSEQLQLLPEYLGNHLLLSAAALFAGISVCLPTALAVSRSDRLQGYVLGFASVMQTVPGIALLAIMVTLFSQIGFLPAVIALFLYSMLPILHNTVTGIRNVDPNLTEAARGLGMTSRQMLWKVELPLATPVIIAGIRIATVWVVGTATLSTPVGATSLGNYIFGGLQTSNSVAVLVGCVAAATLATVLDQLIRLVEIAVVRRNRRLGVAVGCTLFVLLVGGLLPVVTGGTSDSGRGRITIGAKTFTEQYLLSQLLESRLTEAGFSCERKAGMGSIILFQALAENEVDCYVDYSGTVWANVMKRSDITNAEELLSEMKSWLRREYGIACLGPLGFENTYAMAVRCSLADSLGLESIEDLSEFAPQLRMGSDYEFYSRPEWTALKDAYHLTFGELRTFDPTLMYSAIATGQVDVISAYSTDGRIVQNDLVVLADPKQALPPYDAVLLLSPEARQNKSLVNELSALIDLISDENMRRANKLVDVDGLSVAEAAESLAVAIGVGLP